MTFRVTLPIPPSTNTLFPTYKGKRIKSKDYCQWIIKARQIVKAKAQGAVDRSARLHVAYKFFWCDNRARDIANFEKALSDLMVTLRIFDDDSQIDKMTLLRGDKENTELDGLVQVYVEEIK